MGSLEIKILILLTALLGLSSIAVAQENQVSGCGNAIGDSIILLQKRVLDGQLLTPLELVEPYLYYSKLNQELLRVQNPWAARPRIDTRELEYAFLRELSEARKLGCIDELTQRYYQQVAGAISFTSLNDYVVPNEILTQWPRLSVYWINREFFKTIRSETWKEPESEASLSRADQLIKKAFVRKVPGLGKVSVLEYLLLTFNRTRINLLAGPSVDTIKIMGARSGKIVLDIPNQDEPTEIELSPSDIYRLSINYFRNQLTALSSKSFKGQSVAMADSLVAAYLTGELDPQVLVVLMSAKDFKEPKKSFLRSLANTTWYASKIALMQVPATAPYIVLGSLIFEAMDQKKQLERARSESTFLVR